MGKTYWLLQKNGGVKGEVLGASRHVWAVYSQENGPNRHPLKSSFQSRGFQPRIKPCLSGQVKEPREAGSGHGEAGLPDCEVK